MKIKFLLAVGLVAVAFAVVGCKDIGVSPGNPPPVSSNADQIKAIENDKDMPPQAKAIAIAQIKSHGDSGMPKPGAK
jgi:hypothetical protein